MSIRLEVECAMCGVNVPDGGGMPNHSLFLRYTPELNEREFRKMLEEDGWIVQINGQNIDVYCSSECAS